MSEHDQAVSNQPGDKNTRDPLIGTTLEGRYYIEEILGTGGTSVVYKAKQLRFNRYVAIKMMKIQFEKNAVHRERFEREIASLSTLSHPNIVSVYDYTVGPDDQPCVVMDFLKGRSLEALINEDGPLDISRFARIAVQIAGALEHAHRHGIIHRDLKPGNIVLMDEELDFVKVVDFGLARLREENKRLTQTGEFWGSPAYMSPEQCRGKPGDERSDIYSFGAVMFEMLTGKDPFFDAGSVLDVLHKHGYVTPPRFVDVTPQLRIPRALEAVVFKCLEKDADARIQNAREVQNAIIKACSNVVGPDGINQLSSLTQSRIDTGSQGKQPGDQSTGSDKAIPDEPGAKKPGKFSAKWTAAIVASVMLGLLVIYNVSLQGSSRRAGVTTKENSASSPVPASPRKNDNETTGTGYSGVHASATAEVLNHQKQLKIDKTAVRPVIVTHGETDTVDSMSRSTLEAKKRNNSAAVPAVAATTAKPPLLKPNATQKDTGRQTTAIVLPETKRPGGSTKPHPNLSSPIPAHATDRGPDTTRGEQVARSSDPQPESPITDLLPPLPPEPSKLQLPPPGAAIMEARRKNQGRLPDAPPRASVVVKELRNSLSKLRPPVPPPVSENSTALQQWDKLRKKLTDEAKNKSK